MSRSISPPSPSSALSKQYRHTGVSSSVASEAMADAARSGSRTAF
jgi:hypothetical protein